MTFGSADMEAGGGGERRHGQQEEQSSDERRARFAEDWGCCACACAGLFLGPNPMVARYMYALIFLVTNLLAWTLRDYGDSALAELQRLKVCQGALYCLGAEGVLRVSLGCFVFFFVMFLSTVKARKVHDCRNSWHSEWWPAKLALWLGLTAVTFLAPSPLVQLYGKVAHFGAGAFLVIQLISVTRFIMWLNDWCRAEMTQKRYHLQIQAVSIVTYVGSLLGIVLMYVWYAPSPACRLNILFITVTLALVQLMTFVSMSSKASELRHTHNNTCSVKAGYVAPGLMGIYVVFLCWSAIRSEPHTEVCNRKAEVATSADWVNIASFVIAVVVIVAATFSTGIDSKCLQFKQAEGESEEEEEDDIPYGLGFFHLVFSMGAMYFAMIFVGWNANASHTMERQVDDRRRVGEHVGARRQRVAGGNRVHMDDDRARHLEDEAGGIGGGDLG
ncbi:Serinc-domain containing serine and sphingolipid biosynthesis protein [Zea mays]|uniref:Serinc-domain containing serine and sphingolipid biosynthesis protein n=1 Tax=Zea mays TaxID=4577 RepID=A0A1D6FFD8_MAIZE|nr:Serinc-domain containing serine and sphingolipid biosynthesis protein [Zea mays]AQK90654.1 Serinc-domain containing serine and sphingolipid biosynthesis protein [Zea mays]